MSQPELQIEASRPDTQAVASDDVVNRGPRTHVLATGDKLREPTELETLARLPIPVNTVNSDAPADRVKQILDDIRSFRLNFQAARELTPVQRYLIKGAEVAGKQALGEKDENGNPASVRRSLGFDPSTGKAIGSTDGVTGNPEPPNADAVVSTLRDLLASVQTARKNERLWESLAPVQRYFLKGVELICMEALGERDKNGNGVALRLSLGFSLQTAKPLSPSEFVRPQ